MFLLTPCCFVPSYCSLPASLSDINSKIIVVYELAVDDALVLHDAEACLC